MHQSAASSAGITIRPATPGDAEAIARILESSFAPYRPQYTPQAYRATVLSPAEITARLDEGPTWIAQGAQPPPAVSFLGTVSALMTAEGLYIRSMAVRPAAQGRGIARALLSAVEDFARVRSAVQMYLSTTPFLHAAIGLYEKSGFVRTSDGPFDLFGTPIFTMSKELDQRHASS